MKFFVSGKFEDRQNVSKLMDKIQGLGHAITYDWTIDEEVDEGYPVLNTINDLKGVQICDTLACRFIEENNYRGSLVELGIALGLHKRICVIGHGADKCIFVNHPNVQRFETEYEFLSYVRQAL